MSKSKLPDFNWGVINKMNEENPLSPESEKILDTFLERSTKVDLPKILRSPWLEFPNMDRNSIGWRMGPGEDYLILFSEWYLNLPIEEREKYRINNSEPLSWEGFYENLFPVI